jgi:MFS family permease
VHGHYLADVLPVMLLAGGGAGLAMPALMGFAMSSATPGDAGLVSGLFATGAQVGGALGLAVLAALATARTDVLLGGGQATASALTGGYRLAFGVSAAIAGGGILLAAIVLRSPAPPTVQASPDVPAREPRPRHPRLSKETR